MPWVFFHEPYWRYLTAPLQPQVILWLLPFLCLPNKCLRHFPTNGRAPYLLVSQPRWYRFPMWVLTSPLRVVEWGLIDWPNVGFILVWSHHPCTEQVLANCATKPWVTYVERYCFTLSWRTFLVDVACIFVTLHQYLYNLNHVFNLVCSTMYIAMDLTFELVSSPVPVLDEMPSSISSAYLCITHSAASCICNSAEILKCLLMTRSSMKSLPLVRAEE